LDVILSTIYQNEPRMSMDGVIPQHHKALPQMQEFFLIQTELILVGVLSKFLLRTSIPAINNSRMVILGTTYWRLNWNDA
jgi:hypothetical protein